MSKYIIEIDGPISSYYISKNFISNELKRAGSKEVELRISSLGGAVDHALAIHELLVKHGNVTAVLSGFVASSATIIALGAKTIRMSENAFFLVHKVMSYVDEWGLMNEDDLDRVIENLTKNKEENKKMDLVIARIYARKTGKTIEEVHALMQKDTWLNAEETKTWGFVDEVYELDSASKQNFLEDPRRVAMIQASGLPLPKRGNQHGDNNPTPAPTIDQAIEKASNIFIDKVKNLFPGVFPTNANHKTNSKPTQMSNTQKLAALVAVLAVAGLEVDQEGGAFFNAEQLEKLNQLAQENATLKANATTAQNERNQVLNALDEIDPTVKAAQGHEAKVNAIKVKLAAKPGAAPTQNDGGDGKTTDGVNWDVINSLPHNKEVDNNIL
ncbi:MAG: Clp protease ClpP [Breznakibacter sp.]